MPELLRSSPAKIVQKLLIDLGLAVTPGTGGSTSWPVYAPRKPGVGAPDNLIVVHNTLGRVGSREHVSGIRSIYHGIQLWLRCRDVNDGDLKLRQIADTFDGLPPDTGVVLRGRNYSVQTIINTTDVLDIGKETETSSLSLLTLNSLVSVYDLGN